ncbi:MAG: MerR family transcriptional regulator [Acidobacteriota bacterium]
MGVPRPGSTQVAGKLFYKIGEVCEICGIQPHVLRYWESEFPILSPAKNRAGQRIYRPKELELVKTIQRLLHDEGYTVAGARKKLSARGQGEGLPLFRRSSRDKRRTAAAEIRKDLEEILGILDSPES